MPVLYGRARAGRRRGTGRGARCGGRGPGRTPRDLTLPGPGHDRSRKLRTGPVAGAVPGAGAEDRDQGRGDERCRGDAEYRTRGRDPQTGAGCGDRPQRLPPGRGRTPVVHRRITGLGHRPPAPATCRCPPRVRYAGRRNPRRENHWRFPWLSTAHGAERPECHPCAPAALFGRGTLTAEPAAGDRTRPAHHGGDTRLGARPRLPRPGTGRPRPGCLGTAQPDRGRGRTRPTGGGPTDGPDACSPLPSG